MLRRPSRHDERGAVAMIVALCLFIFVGASAMAVDLGTQRVVRSDQQALADVVALDLARDIDGVHNAAYFNLKWATTGSTLAQSMSRNSTTVGFAPGNPGAPWLCNAKACAKAIAGTVDSSGTFQPSRPTQIPSAVLVTATGETKFSFEPGTGSATRTAIGVGKIPPPCAGSCAPSSSPTPTPSPSTPPTPLTPSSVCVEAGTYLASLTTGNSLLLNGLLGHALGVTAVGYNGLAGATINLGLLSAALGVGSVDQLVGLQNLTVGQLVNATAIVLEGPNSNATSVQLSAIRALVATINANPTLAAKVIAGGLSTFLDVTSGDGSVANASVDVLALLLGSVAVINGQSVLNTGVTLPAGSLPAPLDGTALTVGIKVIELPQIGCYPHAASTGQVKVVLTAALPSLSTGSLLNLITLNGGTLGLSVSLATADVTPTSLTCSGSTATSVGVKVTNQSVANVGVDLTNLSLSLLGIPLANAEIHLAVNQGSVTSAEQQLALPNYYAPNMYGLAATTTPLPTITSGNTSSVRLVGLDVGQLLNLGPIVNPILNALNGTIAGGGTLGILPNLSALLGLQLAGADTAVMPTPVCGTVALGYSG